MPHDLNAPRVIVASGMSGTGVSTVATLIQELAPAINVVDGGSKWTDITEACAPGFARLIVVTTHDIVAVSSTYALIKMVRDKFTDAPIEVLVNHSEERDALKTYGRIQAAASHFLGETVGYAGSVPVAHPSLEEPGNEAGPAGQHTLGAAAVMALHDFAMRLDDEMGPTTASRGAWRHGNRRLA